MVQKTKRRAHAFHKAVSQFRETVQPYFQGMVQPETPSAKPLKLVPVVPPHLTRERDALESSYASRLSERADYRKLVTYVPNKTIPVYNWFKYKEGFSRQLVVNLVEKFALSKHSIVYDPFVGCGTTILACKELGLMGIGTDILDVALFVAGVKCARFPAVQILSAATAKLLRVPYKPPTSSMADIRIVGLAFSSQVRDEILFFKERITEADAATRDFLLLGLVSVLEDVSHTSKDGQFLRLVDKHIPTVREALRQVYAVMLADLSSLFTSCSNGKGKTLVLKGDARAGCLPPRYNGTIDAVITSPPYLNRYDYSRSYALELCLLSVASHRDMVAVRHSLLRSHIESKEHSGKEVVLPALDEILTNLRAKELNNQRLPIMVQGYFEDMNLVIANLALYLKHGGHVALVVANAQFAGEYVPTDLLLCELARQHGLETNEIWITRYKGNSSQQMAVYGRRPVRESILFWRKP